MNRRQLFKTAIGSVFSASSVINCVAGDDKDSGEYVIPDLGIVNYCGYQFDLNGKTLTIQKGDNSGIQFFGCVFINGEVHVNRNDQIFNGCLFQDCAINIESGVNNVSITNCAFDGRFIYGRGCSDVMCNFHINGNRIESGRLLSELLYGKL